MRTRLISREWIIGQANGQGQGHFAQNASYSQTSVNMSDNGILIEMIQTMKNNFLNRLTSIEQNVSILTVIESEMQQLRSGMSNLQMNNTQIIRKTCPLNPIFI